MAILDKLQFWKRDELGIKDELALPKGNLPTEDFNLETPGLPRTPNIGQQMTQPMQAPTQPPQMESLQERSYAPPPQYASQNRDLELVAAKLDALKATLENINQRLANLERVAYGEEEQHRKGW